jgi:ABC-type bacteriocin/lantibiotic exporter with double-glycine peptidase domain
VNSSIRHNIVMERDDDTARYQQVLALCELQEDLRTIPGGDMAEIGSKGINLSGGQKQRVAIARAVYADADVYIIDDCFSALDAQVGQAIFQNVLLEALKSKTRVLITNATHLLHSCQHSMIEYILQSSSYRRESSSPKAATTSWPRPLLISATCPSSPTRVERPLPRYLRTWIRRRKREG